MQKLSSSDSPWIEKLELVCAIFPIPILVIIAISIPKFAMNMSKAQAAEITSNAASWSKMQKDYYLETEEVGNAEQIGSSLHINSESSDVTYTTEVEEETIAFFIAKNKNNIDGCPAGNEWQVIAEVYEDGLNFEIYLPENENCKKLTPNFKERITEAVTAKDNL